MASGNFLTPTKNFLMEPFGLFPNLNRMMEEPLTMLRPMLPLEENYWPMKPWTSSRNRGSVMKGAASLKSLTNQRSPAGSSRCRTLMTWVAVGSSGIQCKGV